MALKRTSTDDDDVSLEGSVRDLTTQSELICDPHRLIPSDLCANFLLEIRPTQGKASLRWEADTLVIDGGLESRGVLAENVLFLANQEYVEGRHMHVEYNDYVGEESYLSEASLPAVLYVRPDR